MESDQEELKRLLSEKIDKGNTLLVKLATFPSLNGKSKLERRIIAELKFLQKLQKPNALLKKDHISSSNLLSLSAILDVLEQSSNPVAVLQPFALENAPVDRIEVDVVADGGATWYKATARNPEALNEISKGRSDSGQRSIVHQTRLFLQCANEHLHFFQAPRVVFFFASGIGKTLAAKLLEMGVEVLGKMIELNSSEDDTSSSEDELDTFISKPVENVNDFNDKFLFLDITCMVAYVSSMTNGGANFKFPKDIFNQQADWERTRPAKIELDALFVGKELVTSRSAFDDFKALVDTMGGVGEKQRTADLIQRLQIIPDNPSERVLRLKLSSSVKERSRIIFGTADQHQMAIVTANTGFIRSAEGQGVTIAVHSHEPRVLSEAQEIYSIPFSL